jgi:hypothetical protein
MLFVFTGAITTNMGNEAPPTQNIYVVNIPSANVSNTPNVQAGNTTTNPVPIRDVDNAAGQPFQINLGIKVAAGDLFATGSFTVPTCKQLVIEFVSALAAISSGENLTLQFTTIAGGACAPFTLPAFLQSTFGGTVDDYAVAQLMQVYADPGRSVRFLLSQSTSNAGALADIDVSGYLVNEP